MGYSSLACRFYQANENNFTYGRSGYNLSKITIHHCAGVMSAESIGDLWQNPNRETSSNYGIGVDGEIMCYVDENNTSWCDSNWVSNCTSITIENSNSSCGGEWPVSDSTLDSLIKLCADISIRNGLGLLVPGQNLTWHSMYSATECPGDYLRARMQYIADKSNEIISGGKHIIEVDGLWGKDTSRKIQEVFDVRDYDGNPIRDGIISNQLVWWRDENPGLLDSSFEWQDSMKGGSLTMCAIQHWLGVEEDGYIGSTTISALQRKLNMSVIDGCISNPSAVVSVFQQWLNEQ